MSRIFWVSNAPIVQSGYGTQTALILPRLRALGHDLACLGVVGTTHGLINIDGIPLYPKGSHRWGHDVAGAYAKHFKADLTVLFLDAWVMDPRDFAAQGSSGRMVSLFPVDHEPAPPAVLDAISHAWARITYSRHGLEQVAKVGLDAYYAPHGVDTTVYCPMDKATARKTTGIPDDGRLIVGAVAANHDPCPSRKGWEHILPGFARFRQEHRAATGQDSLLYLHTWVRGGVDIEALVRECQIEDAILVCDPVNNSLGFPTDYMRATYNSFDVLLLPSAGEGCGLPLLEAGACGVPAITGDWTAMPEYHCGGVLIPKEKAHRRRTNLNAFQWFVDESVVTEAMHQWAAGLATAPLLAAQCRAKAMEFDIDRVVLTYWKPILDALEERIAIEQQSVAPVRQESPQATAVAALAQAKAAPPSVLLVCPSLGERCGIAAYTQSVAGSLRAAGYGVQVVDTVASACQIALEVPSVQAICLQHEYAFFDNRNARLCRGETSPGFVRQFQSLVETRPDVAVSILMHTVSPKSGELAANTLLTRSGLALYSTSIQGAQAIGIRCLPLGSWGIPGWEPQERESGRTGFTIGNFGMFGAHRDIPAHIALCKATGSAFLGSFYCEFDAQKSILQKRLAEAGIKAELYTDFAEEPAVMARLSRCDVLYMPRPDVGLFYSSASVVTAMNAQRPILINSAAGCYDDLLDVLTVVETPEEAIQAVERLKDPAEWEKAVAKIREWRRRREIANVWAEAGVIPPLDSSLVASIEIPDQDENVWVKRFKESDRRLSKVSGRIV